MVVIRLVCRALCKTSIYLYCVMV